MMENDETQNADAVAGWYPDQEGTTRWWDGTAWTDQTQQNEAAAAPVPQPKQTPANGSEPFYKRRWFVGVVAGFIGIGIGAAGAAGTPVKDSPEYKSVATDLNETQGKLRTAEVQVEGITAREGKAAAAETKLDGRADDLKSAETAVLKREKRVGIVERKIRSNTIDGNGIYEVGEDIKAGTYKTKGPDDSGMDNCYFAVNGDANGNDILSNNNVSGQAVVSVRKGQYLETTGCQDWVKQ